jgi:hypothetical protein
MRHKTQGAGPEPAKICILGEYPVEWGRESAYYVSL